MSNICFLFAGFFLFKKMLTNQLLWFIFSLLSNQPFTGAIHEAIMKNRFEDFTTNIAQIYKSIQKIKKHHMQSLGLKSTYVMCLHHLAQTPEGITAADLCRLCKENKAGISRILSDMAQEGFIRYANENDGKKYRAKALLTDTGRKYALEINRRIADAVARGSMGITEQERETFYRILFRITENLNQLCTELSEGTGTQ